MTETGICPKCNGSPRRPYGPDNRQYAKITFGYDAATDTLQCDNCGGQTMSLNALGVSKLRPDGTTCLHEFVGRKAGNCYHEYTCKHCTEVYYIDSGD